MEKKQQHGGRPQHDKREGHLRPSSNIWRPNEAESEFLIEKVEAQGWGWDDVWPVTCMTNCGQKGQGLEVNVGSWIQQGILANSTREAV